MINFKLLQVSVLINFSRRNSLLKKNVKSFKTPKVTKWSKVAFPAKFSGSLQTGRPGWFPLFPLLHSVMMREAFQEKLKSGRRRSHETESPRKRIERWWPGPETKTKTDTSCFYDATEIFRPNFIGWAKLRLLDNGRSEATTNLEFYFRKKSHEKLFLSLACLGRETFVRKNNLPADRRSNFSREGLPEIDICNSKKYFLPLNW